MAATLHRLRWLAPGAVLALAAILRLWALHRPDSLVFDELYYVRDAVSQLAHGFTTMWPDDDPAFGGERAALFTDEPNAIAHPPLGKWLIGLGILVFGTDSGWGWRISVAVFGIIAVALTMLLGWLISRNLWITTLAGLLLAVDGVHVVMSRVSILDGFLATLVLLGAVFVWMDQERWRTDRLWARPWLFAAGATFGAAAAVKWSGLYALAGFLVLMALRDWWLLRRRGQRHAFWTAALRATVSGVIAIGTAFAAYLASWIGWILHPGAQNRHEGEPWWISLAQWHADALSWHTTLTAPHPYATSAITWPLDLRPTSMYLARWSEGCPWNACVQAITPIPNPLVTWGGVVALLLLLWALLRGAVLRGTLPLGPVLRTTGRAASGRRESGVSERAIWVSAFLLAGYLSGWLPWVLTLSRSAVFQFYAVVLTPFAALALAWVLTAVATLPSRAGDPLRLAGLKLRRRADAVHGRRIAVILFTGVTLLLGIAFFPLWSATPIAEWFWRAHLWLPGWN